MAAQWILFMSCVNHDCNGGLVGAFRGMKGGGKKKTYIKLVVEKECRFLAKG
jgi:hypothetical protein